MRLGDFEMTVIHSSESNDGSETSETRGTSEKSGKREKMNNANH